MEEKLFELLAQRSVDALAAYIIQCIEDSRGNIEKEREWRAAVQLSAPRLAAIALDSAAPSLPSAHARLLPSSRCFCTY